MAPRGAGKRENNWRIERIESEKQISVCVFCRFRKRQKERAPEENVCENGDARSTVFVFSTLNAKKKSTKRNEKAEKQTLKAPRPIGGWRGERGALGNSCVRPSSSVPRNCSGRFVVWCYFVFLNSFHFLVFSPIQM